MASNKLLLIYQDCFTCYGKCSAVASPKEAVEAGIEIERVPHTYESATFSAKAAIIAAAKAAVRLPFYTDGEKCSQNICDFIQKKSKTKKAEQ